MRRGGADDASRELQERVLHDPAVHGAAAARPLDQRHGDVPRPDVLRARSARRSCRCCAPIRSSRIWHAGCSTGEEVYSLAILLEEEGLYERTRIYATDINEARARDGARRASSRSSRCRSTRRTTSRAGGTRTFSEYYIAGVRRRALRPRADRATSSSRSTTSSPTARSTSSTSSSAATC